MNKVNVSDEPERKRQRRCFLDNTKLNECLLTKNHAVIICFQDFHYRILKALNNNNNDDEEDVLIMIENFIKNRDGILQKKYETKSIQEIHKESLRFLHESESYTLDGTTTTVSAVIGGSISTPIAIKGNSSIASDTMHHHASPLQPSLSQTTTTTTATFPVDNTTANFQIITRLFQSRKHIIQKQYVEQTNQFQTLLKSVQEKIHMLQLERNSLIETLNSSSKESKSDLFGDLSSTAVDTAKKTETSKNQKSCIEEFEIQIKLWSLLEQDLRNTIHTG